MLGGLFSSAEEKYSEDLVTFFKLMQERSVERIIQNDTGQKLGGLSLEDISKSYHEEMSMPVLAAFTFQFLLALYGKRGDVTFGHLSGILHLAGYSDDLQITVPLVMAAYNEAAKYRRENGDDGSALGDPIWVIAKMLGVRSFGEERGHNALIVLYLQRIIGNDVVIIDRAVREIGQERLGAPSS